MGKSSFFDHQTLLLIFNATAIPNIADNAASAPLTTLYVALHSADPTVTGNQSTFEVAYAGYARVPVTRDVAGWAVVNNVATPVNPILFPICTAGNTSASFFSIGEAPTGNNEILYYGTVIPNMTIAPGSVPELTTASSVTET